MGAKQRLNTGNGGARALKQWVALARIPDRWPENLSKRHRAVVSEQQHIRIKHPWHAGREQAGTRNQVKTERSVVLDAGSGRRRPLATKDFGTCAADVMKDDRNIATRTVKVWFDDLQRECGGNRRVKSIAALLQDRHTDRSRDPMGRSNDPECAIKLRARGKRVGADECHPGILSCGARAGKTSPARGTSRGSQLGAAEPIKAEHKRLPRLDGQGRNDTAGDDHHSSFERAAMVSVKVN